MKTSCKLAMILLAVLLLAVPVLAACGDDDETSEPSPEQTVSPTTELTVEPTETSEPSLTNLPTAELTPGTEGWPAGMTFYRNPDFPEGYQNPIAHLPVPQHPFLAPNEKSNMHNDAYMTDTYETSGPLGLSPKVTLNSYAPATNLCVMQAFDSKGRILTVNARPDAFYLLIIDPDTLEEIASFPLPPRHSDDPLYPYNDTSGGAYFILDNEDRVMLADADNCIEIIKYNDDLGELQLVQKYDLNDYVVPFELPARDHVQMTLPDWEGRLWFMTRYGKVGTINQETGEIRTIELTGEEMQNSFTMGEDGAYFITDYAMYRFQADEDGVPMVIWRTEYDRGSRVKPSMMNQGSGTTPQLFGDMVAIGDNADPKMNIIFLRRSDGSEVCRIPVFDDDISTTENALPGFVREGREGLEYSVIVENNYGKLSENLLRPGGCCVDSVGGLSRIDLIPDGGDGYTCNEIWVSPENSCSPVPKLCLGNGLLYLYTYEKLPDNPPPNDFGYYLTAVDFETGQTVFRIPTGTGTRYIDFGASITIVPGGGKIHIGSMGGLVTIQDTVQ
ncbi:MAG: hypothetical protein HQ553_08495 [Chloroflexi bacterium]|nr:hypothetical protein [Chloroflexota bacterium]